MIRKVWICVSTILLTIGCQQAAREDAEKPRKGAEPIDWGALLHPDARIRAQACTKLRHANRETVQALIHMLADLDSDVREAAGTSLMNIIEESKIPSLIAALDSQNPAQRYGAAYMLGRIGLDAYGSAHSAIDKLKQCLVDPVERVRVCSAWALCHLDVEDRNVLEVLAAGLESRELSVLNVALEGLMEYVDRRAEILLTEKPPKMLSTLLRTLRNEDANWRTLSAHILGSCGDCSEPTIAGLKRALDDPDEEVRRAAAYAFSTLRPKEIPVQVFDLLCKEMDRERGYSYYRQACWALDRLNQFPPRVVETLTNHLDDSEPKDRLEVACLLSRHPKGSARKIVQILIDLLKLDRIDIDSHDREKAICALGKLGLTSEVARQALRTALEDPDVGVRDLARKLLADFGAKEP